MIRLILADDHTLVTEALRSLIEREQDMCVVGQAIDGASAVRLARETEPDVVVMDVTMPGLSGIEATRQLRQELPDIKVLALSTHLDRHVVQEMLDAGAAGYIVKSAAGSELLKGVRSVMAGQSYLCPEVTALVTDSLRGRRAAARRTDHPGLSPRELQVIKLLADGKSAPEVAGALHISPGTVDVHRRNIMRKLQMHNVVDLTKYAIRTGLIQP